MLCDECQIREATVHFTTCSSRAGEESKHINLCQECYEASDREEVRALPKDFQATFQAGCRYCGGEPASGGIDSLALLGGVRRWSFMCKPCAEEYFGLLRRKLPGFGEPDLTPEQSAGLVANLKACDFPSILGELDKHLKQWVAKKKSQ